MSQVIVLAGGISQQFFSGSGTGVIRTVSVMGGAQVATLEIFEGGSSGGALETDRKKLVLKSPANDSRSISDCRVDFKGDLFIKLTSTGVGAEAIVQRD